MEQMVKQVGEKFISGMTELFRGEILQKMRGFFEKEWSREEIDKLLLMDEKFEKDGSQNVVYPCFQRPIVNADDIEALFERYYQEDGQTQEDDSSNNWLMEKEEKRTTINREEYKQAFTNYIISLNLAYDRFLGECDLLALGVVQQQIGNVKNMVDQSWKNVEVSQEKTQMIHQKFAAASLPKITVKEDKVIEIEHLDSMIRDYKRCFDFCDERIEDEMYMKLQLFNGTSEEVKKIRIHSIEIDAARLNEQADGYYFYKVFSCKAMQSRGILIAPGTGEDIFVLFDAVEFDNNDGDWIAFRDARTAQDINRFLITLQVSSHTEDKSVKYQYTFLIKWVAPSENGRPEDADAEYKVNLCGQFEIEKLKVDEING